MCEQHKSLQLSRRGFAGLALGAMGMAAFPLAARAAGGCSTLALTCIDYRLVDDGVKFFDRLKLTNDYDQVELAGAGLAAVSKKFPSANKAFWDQLAIAKTLHHVRQVIVLDHRDCGAYKVAFGKDYAGEHDAETAQHRGVLMQMQAMLKKKHPDLTSAYYLLALDGTAEKLI